ncbi:putative MFS monocarboxylate transporter [Xylariaceae sp. FL0255]|nr:putative MFS monocarboxylate transporter [Xylariaceae sp. FL0255]
MAPPQIPRPEDYNSTKSWLAVLGASFALYSTVGYVNAFGVFQEYYAQTLLKEYTESDISWIGSVAIFLFFLLAPAAGVAVDKFGSSTLLVIGSVGQLIAIFLSSLATQYYQLFLSQSVLLGLSMAFILTPAVAVVSRRMPHRRGLALGIVIGGSSIAGVIWPILLDRLLYSDGVGFGWTMRIVGFNMLPLLAIAIITVKDVPVKKNVPAPEPNNTAVTTDESGSDQEKPKAKSPVMEVITNPTYAMLCGSMAFVYLGLFIPFFYISSYAVAKGVSSGTSLYLISAINASSFFGRVLPGYFADKYGHFNILVLGILFSGVISLTWTAAFNLPGMIFFSLAYGFTSGTIISLQTACAAKVSKREHQGRAIGLLQGAEAIPALIGTPISGQILLRSGYVGLSIFTGIVLIAGGIGLTITRLRIDRKILANY